MRALWIAIAVLAVTTTTPALAQDAPPAPDADPAAPPGSAEPGAAAPAPPGAAPAPAGSGQAQPQPPPAGYDQQPAPGGYGQQPPPAGYPQQQQAPPAGYPQQQRPPPAGYPPQPPPSQQQVPPPPPPQRYEGQVGGGYQDPTYPDMNDEPSGGGGGKGWSPSGFSVRLDPLNWLIEGRLGFELELGILDWLSVEMIPVMVANEEPPAFNLRGRDDTVRQESNGAGPFSGASLGVGFWLSATAFKGYVIRVSLTNYSYSYVAEDDGGVFDQVDHVDRHLAFFFGSHSRWGVFTIAGGIELGYELNQEERCELARTSDGTFGASNTSDCDGELRIAVEDRTDPATGDLNGFLHPVTLGARFSLGLAFD